MHALICQGNGKYYVSTAFGFYKNITAAEGYERYLQSIHNPRWIVWNEEKTRLIEWPAMAPDTQYLIPLILIVDADESGWVENEEGEGCVSFLSKEVIDSLLRSEQQPEEILAKCRAIDAGYTYNETPEIKTEADIKSLYWATGWFHDSRIVKQELQEDGTLYLRFDGTWGCDVEVWLWGDLEYDTSSRDPEKWDPYWQGSTVLIQDGFVYFIDEEDMTVDRINDSYCYFKARHMKYRVIPL